MDIKKLKADPELQAMIKRVTDLRDSNDPGKAKRFSDIIDDAGYQYVDLVMEGGGMLGIALVGYTYVLEQAGIRFLGLGGTSAGSINALLLAALGPPAQAKGEMLLQELGNKNFYDFVDGDSDARDLIESWIDGDGPVRLGFKAIQVIDNIKNDLGLNPGKAFRDWIGAILRREGIRSKADLQTRLDTVPKGLRLRSGDALDTPAKAKAKLAIIAADVSTETKVEFPKMAALYWKDPEQADPADFVRASMSIPFFFHPMRVDLKKLPRTPELRELWENEAGYQYDEEKGLPAEAIFIDGGIMSNFPIDVFHDPNCVPDAPTFGAKLELDQRRKSIKGPMGLFGAIFNSARHSLDYEFIHRNPDYRRLVTWIPAEGYNWLDFNMPEAKKKGLFMEGARCAADFLSAFDWDGYKKIRAGMKLAAKAAQPPN